MMRNKQLNEMKGAKTHYKMYKSGKLWLFAGMTALAVGAFSLNGDSAHADTVNNSNPNSSGDNHSFNSSADSTSQSSAPQTTQGISVSTSQTDVISATPVATSSNESSNTSVTSVNSDSDNNISARSLDDTTNSTNPSKQTSVVTITTGVNDSNDISNNESTITSMQNVSTSMSNEITTQANSLNLATSSLSNVIDSTSDEVTSIADNINTFVNSVSVSKDTTTYQRLLNKYHVSNASDLNATMTSVYTNNLNSFENDATNDLGSLNDAAMEAYVDNNTESSLIAQADSDAFNSNFQTDVSSFTSNQSDFNSAVITVASDVAIDLNNSVAILNSNQQLSNQDLNNLYRGYGYGSSTASLTSDQVASIRASESVILSSASAVYSQYASFASANGMPLDQALQYNVYAFGNDGFVVTTSGFGAMTDGFTKLADLQTSSANSALDSIFAQYGVPAVNHAPLDAARLTKNESYTLSSIVPFLQGQNLLPDGYFSLMSDAFDSATKSSYAYMASVATSIGTSSGIDSLAAHGSSGSLSPYGQGLYYYYGLNFGELYSPWYYVPSSNVYPNFDSAYAYGGQYLFGMNSSAMFTMGSNPVTDLFAPAFDNSMNNVSGGVDLLTGSSIANTSGNSSNYAIMSNYVNLANLRFIGGYNGDYLELSSLAQHPEDSYSQSMFNYFSSDISHYSSSFANVPLNSSTASLMATYSQVQSLTSNIAYTFQSAYSSLVYPQSASVFSIQFSTYNIVASAYDDFIQNLSFSNQNYSKASNAVTQLQSNLKTVSDVNYQKNMNQLIDSYQQLTQPQINAVISQTSASYATAQSIVSQLQTLMSSYADQYQTSGGVFTVADKNNLSVASIKVNSLASQLENGLNSFETSSVANDLTTYKTADSLYQQMLTLQNSYNVSSTAAASASAAQTSQSNKDNIAISNAQSSASNAQASANSYAKQYQQASSALNSLQINYNNLSSATSGELTSYANEVKSLNAEISSQNTNLTTLSNAIKSLDATNANLSSANNNLSNANINLTNSNAKLTSDNSALSNANASLATKVSQVSTAYQLLSSSANNTINSLNAAKASATALYNQTSSAYNALNTSANTTIKSLQAVIASQNVTNASQSATINSLRAQISTLSSAEASAVSNYQSETSAYRTLNSSANSTIASLTNELAQLNQKADSLASANNSQSALINSLKSGYHPTSSSANNSSASSSIDSGFIVNPSSSSDNASNSIADNSSASDSQTNASSSDNDSQTSYTSDVYVFKTKDYLGLNNKAIPVKISNDDFSKAVSLFETNPKAKKAYNNRSVKLLRHAYIHSKLNFGSDLKKKAIRPGQTFKIKDIVIKHGITRLVIGHHQYITGNTKFVKFSSHKTHK